jgi:DNA-binding beta-propeller fold protein YncE
MLVCLVLCSGKAAAAPGDYVESFGPDGTTGTEFGRTAALALDQQTGAVYVADSETQVLYKFNAAGEPLDYGGASGYISGNEITGLSLNEGGPGKVQVAVDSSTHVIYVASANKIRAFEADGEPHEFTAGPGAGTSEIPGATELFGLAVDEDGNIYASDFADKKLRIYSPSGALLTEFTPTGNQLSVVRPAALAVAADGTLYVTELDGAVFAFEPSKFPLTAKTTYGLGSPLNENLSVSVAVDPKTQYVYISENCEEGVCQNPVASQLSVYDELGNFVDRIAGEEPGELRGAVPGIGVNGPGERIYAAVRGEAGGLSQVSVFESLPIPEGPPTIKGLAVTDLTSSTAVLLARINPNTLETTYWFEYGLSDCAAEPGSCTKIPADGASIGSGHNPVSVSAALNELAPGTRYFFRVVAENDLGTDESVTRAFTTRSGNLGSRLSDDRVWELVTPTNKFGGVPTNAALVQADPEGDGIAFHTRGSIVEDPESNRALEASATLARRSGSGWSVSDLVPPHTEAGGFGFGPEFKLFSQDLDQAVFEPRDNTPLSPESSERAPYLRTNSSPPVYRPLVTSKEGFANVPPGTIFGGEANGERNPVSISAANGSLTHVVLSSRTPLVSGAAKRSIYLWSDGALEPVSELPAAEGGGIVAAQPGSGTLSVRHAVSEDGSRVFWAPGDPLTSSLDWPALYLRDTIADESVRLDVPEAGASGAGEPHPAFMVASADGSVVYFTDSQQLTEDASPDGRDLYRCEIGDVGGSLGCVDLENLSAPLPGSGESGDAEELAVGIAEDGETIYFVAGAVLDPGPNGAGETAVPDSPNLYLWQEGLGVQFIASLSESDAPDWGDTAFKGGGAAHAARGAAASSPSGRYLVFMSEQNLAGAESNDPATGKPVEHAFLYDSAADQLTCISCNPSGATDPGHRMTSGNNVVFPDPQQLWIGRLVGATLPETTEGEPTVGFALRWPRAVLDNGRAYFNSTNPLVNSDSNETWDVYQYEPVGVGDCDSSAGSGIVEITETGCVGLISSGSDSLPSAFMDASSSGDDVFFATFGRLSPLDTDEAPDIYDARVNGVQVTVEQHTECNGEACQHRGLPPGESAPNSSTFNGAGNLKQKPRKHCKKGQRKVKQKGKTKCVKAKKGKKQRKSAQTQGRA